MIRPPQPRPPPMAQPPCAAAEFKLSPCYNLSRSYWRLCTRCYYKVCELPDGMTKYDRWFQRKQDADNSQAERNADNRQAERNGAEEGGNERDDDDEKTGQTPVTGKPAPSSEPETTGDLRNDLPGMSTATILRKMVSLQMDMAMLVEELQWRNETSQIP